MNRVAGITNDAEDRVIREQAVWAVPEANTCSLPLPRSSRMLKMPPRKKHMPITKSRLERIEPSMDDLTTSIWLFRRATILT
jgi:hypothetical protein